MMSVALKSVAAFVSVKPITAVSPASSAVLSLVMVMVGAVVSVTTTVLTVMLTLLLASAPSVLALPAASVNLPLETLTVAAVVLLAVGVNVAV